MNVASMRPLLQADTGFSLSALLGGGAPDTPAPAPMPTDGPSLAGVGFAEVKVPMAKKRERES
jgi:hypothetical protein